MSIVARLSAKSKYRVIALTPQELTWIHNLMREISFVNAFQNEIMV